MTRWILLATVCLALGACADSSQKAPVAKAAAEAEHDHAADDGHDHGKSDEGGGDEHDHEHEEGEPDFAKIDPARSAELGIVVATAASGNVDEVLTLTGRLIIDPRRVAAVRALVHEVPVEGRIVFTRRARFPKGLPKWTLTLDSLLLEFPPADATMIADVRARYSAAWEQVKAAVKPSPLGQPRRFGLA